VKNIILLLAFMGFFALLGCATLSRPGEFLAPPSPQVTVSTLSAIQRDIGKAEGAAAAALERGDEPAAAAALDTAEKLAALHARAVKLSQPSALETGAEQLAAVGEIAGVTFPPAGLAGMAAAAVAGLAGAFRAFQWKQNHEAAKIMALAIEEAPADIARPIKLAISQRAAGEVKWLQVNAVAQRAAAQVKRHKFLSGAEKTAALS